MLALRGRVPDGNEERAWTSNLEKSGHKTATLKVRISELYSGVRSLKNTLIKLRKIRTTAHTI